MPRKAHKYHYLYKTTNLINNKFYYGMHSTSNLEDGYLGSGKKLRYSIRKYGKENFKIEHLEFFDTRELLIEAEIKLINEESLKDPLCMNLKPGGSGGICNKEHGKKLSDSGNNKLIWLSKNNLEWKEKKSKNQSSGHIKSYKNGRIIKPFNWTGHKHSEETKNKMRGHVRQTGEKNSQFGTCWIYNDFLKKNKRIKREDLINFINEGWIKGMNPIYNKCKS